MCLAFLMTIDYNRQRQGEPHSKGSSALIKYIIIGFVVLFILVEIVKTFVFLKIAIGRVKERKKAEKISKKDMVEAIYQTKSQKSQEWILAQNPEEITIEGHHQTILKGHFLRAKDEKRIIIAFHGWHGSWKSDFSLCTEKFLEQGCSILLVEQRAHGRSGGKHIGFGILERYDCKKWAEYIEERFGKEMPTYLYGVSMGASTVLMASSLHLPENMKGIIADCGFTTPYQMVVRFAHKILKIGEYPDVPMVNKLCQVMAGYDFKEYSTLDAMKVCKLPVLFIHGTKDYFVPYYMTLENFHQCKARKELLLVEGAGHCRSFYMAPEEYMQKIQQFFQWNRQSVQC